MSDRIEAEILDALGEEVDAAIDTPLVVIEGTKGEPGADGITPTIGSNGNWFLGATDTGKPSRGATGAPGKDGSDATVTAASIKGALGYTPAAPGDIPVVPTAEISANTGARHSHANKAVIDGITAAKTAAWDGKAGTAAATQSAAGLMSAADKAKLDGIERGANKTTVPTALKNPKALTIQIGGTNKAQVGWAAIGANMDAASLIHLMPGDTLRIKGASLPDSQDGKSIAISYSETATFLSAGYIHNGYSWNNLEFTTVDNVVTITGPAEHYLRLSLICADASAVIVTINEPIT